MRTRRGQVALEVMTFIIIITIFAITAVVMANVVKPIDTAIQNADVSQSAKTVSDNATGKFVRSMNSLSPIILMFFWIAGIVSAFLIDTHPAFMVISIILIVFIVLFAAIMANIYDDITTPLDRTDFNMTTWIMSRLVYVSLFMAASIIIVMFSKSRGGGGLF